MFEENEKYRKQLDELGYKDVTLWNILVKLRDKTLGKEVLKNVAKMEQDINEYQQKHGNIGRYQREFKILCDMKINLDKYKQENYKQELIEPLNMALDELYYSNSIEVQNRSMRVAIKFIQENFTK